MLGRFLVLVWRRWVVATDSYGSFAPSKGYAGEKVRLCRGCRVDIIGCDGPACRVDP